MLLLTKYTVLYKENEICCIILLSLPSRERGLKFCKKDSEEKVIVEKLKPYSKWLEYVRKKGVSV